MSTSNAHAQFEFFFDDLHFEEGEELDPVRFQVAAMLSTRRSLDPAKGAEAWQMAVKTLGCFVTGTSVDGTASDVMNLPDEPDEPEPGTGFQFTEFSGNTAIVVVIRDLFNPAPLLPVQSPHALLQLSLEGNSSCTSCFLEFVDGVRGQGRPIDNLVTSEGETARPLLRNRSIDWRPEPCNDPPLDLDSLGSATLNARLSLCQRGACFAVRTPVGKNLVLALDDPTNGDHEIFVRWGERPTPEDFDAAHVVFDGFGRITQPTRDDVAYVLLKPIDPAVQVSTVALTTSLDDLVLQSVSPNQIARGQSTRLRVSGAGFRADVTRFFLARGNGDCDDEVADADCIASTGPARVLNRNTADVVFAIPADWTLDTSLLLKGINPGVDPRTLNPGVTVRASTNEATSASISGGQRPVRGVPAGFELLYRNLDSIPRCAPLFRLRGPPSVSVKLGADEDFVDCFERDECPQEILVFGVDPRGSAGLLASSENQLALPISFVGGRAIRSAFIVEQLTPPASKFVWEDFPTPPGIAAADWPGIAGGLSKTLGADFATVYKRLAESASRISLRGDQGASVDKVFRFAVREVLDRPSSAILGKVLHETTEAPVENVIVVAKADGQPISWDSSDDDGNFAIDWLESGEAYSIEVGDRVVLEITSDDWNDVDIAGIEIFVADGETGDPDDRICSTCNFEGLPSSLPAGFTETFASTQKFRWPVTVVGSVDPNSKDGPEGEQNPNEDLPFIGAGEPHTYQINFENIGTGPVSRVVIEDQLSSVFDWKSVRFRLAKFSEQDPILLEDCTDEKISGNICPEVISPYHAEFIVEGFHFWPTPNSLREYSVRIVADANPATGLLRWEFTTLINGQVPEDPEAGFLPPACPIDCRGLTDEDLRADPNAARDCLEETCLIEECDAEGCRDVFWPDCFASCTTNDYRSIGNGYVTFTVELKSETEENSEADNEATIRFDPVILDCSPDAIAADAERARLCACDPAEIEKDGPDSDIARACGISTDPAAQGRFSRFEPPEPAQLLEPSVASVEISQTPTLEWQAPGSQDAAAHYDVYVWECPTGTEPRSESEFHYAESLLGPAFDPGNATTSIPKDRPLDFQTQYCWEVVTRNKRFNNPKAEDSSTSPVSTFTTGCFAPPSDLTVDADGGTVAFDWNGPTGADIVYEVIVSECERDVVARFETVENHYEPDEALPPACYEWTVRVSSMENDCDLSSENQTFTVCPAPPSDLDVISGACSGTPTLAWTPSAGVSTYCVTITKGDEETTICADGESLEITEALSPGSYSWTVSARVDPLGPQCPPSETESLNVSPPQPSAPRISHAGDDVDPNSDDRITLSWDGDAESYLVRVFDVGEAVPQTEEPAPSSTHTLSTLRAGDYEFEIVALNGQCSSKPSPRTPLTVQPGGKLFVRGDADSSGEINLTDGINILLFLFSGGRAPSCMNSADVDDSGDVNLSDPIRIFGWLFLGASELAEPNASSARYVNGDCGPDESPDNLDCVEMSTSCAGA